MIGVDAASRLPIVLLVDPETASRFTLWRLLSRSFGVLEAPDARQARDWLASPRRIDALVVDKRLPDADGTQWVASLAAARVDAASRAIVVTKPVDLRAVATSLAGWFFPRNAREAEALRRDAARMAGGHASSASSPSSS